MDCYSTFNSTLKEQKKSFLNAKVPFPFESHN